MSNYVNTRIPIKQTYVAIKFKRKTDIYVIKNNSELSVRCISNPINVYFLFLGKFIIVQQGQEDDIYSSWLSARYGSVVGGACSPSSRLCISQLSA